MTEHSPSQTAERAIYGFVLYLSSWVCLGLYIIWAYIPDKWLHAIGLTYWPQKYWAIAAPTYLCVLGVFCLVFYVARNFMITKPLNSCHTISDEFSRFLPSGDHLHKDSIPPISDIHISDVNDILYGTPSHPHD